LYGKRKGKAGVGKGAARVDRRAIDETIGGSGLEGGSIDGEADRQVGKSELKDCLTDIVDAAEAATMLEVTRQHVVHLFRTGRIEGRLLTATWVTTRQAVESYERRRRGPGRPRRESDENT